MSAARDLAKLGNQDALKVDTTNTRVGIGSTVPDEALDVVGVVSATDGFNIGISSGGVSIGSTLKTLNFVGSGNTVVDRGNGSIDISISGSGGGGGLGTALSDESTDLLSQIFTTTRNETVAAGTSVSVEGGVGGGNMTFTKLSTITVATGATFHVSTGTTFVMNVLNIF